MTGGADAAALSALTAAQQSMITLGNNASNSNTVGYKQERASFSTLVAGTTNPNSFAAGGVRAKPVRLADEQGLLKSTTSPTDLSVSGNGFFVVGKFATVATGGTNEIAYTRAGEFLPDKDGNLRNTGGFYLQGWPTDQNGVPTVTDKNSLSQLETIKINKIAGISTPTSEIDIKLNLPSQAAVAATQQTNMEIFDSLGQPHILQMTWTKTSNVPLTWDLAIGLNPGADGVVTQNASGGAAYNAVTVVFNGNGQPVTYGGAAAPPNIYIDWANAATDSNITFGLGTPNTNDGIRSTYGVYSETALSQNGKESGQLSGIDITDDGVVQALFSNGESLKIYKIPLANFASPHALASKDGNVWIQTSLSGNYLLSDAKQAGMGSIKSNALELSTVELADVFTQMMETSRFYAGNVKVIQTSEDMFNELKMIKR